MREAAYHEQKDNVHLGTDEGNAFWLFERANLSMALAMSCPRELPDRCSDHRW